MHVKSTNYGTMMLPVTAIIKDNPMASNLTERIFKNLHSQHTDSINDLHHEYNFQKLSVRVIVFSLINNNKKLRPHSDVTQNAKKKLTDEVPAKILRPSDERLTAVTAPSCSETGMTRWFQRETNRQNKTAKQFSLDKPVPPYCRCKLTALLRSLVS